MSSAFEFEFTMNHETDFEFMKLNIRFFKNSMKKNSMFSILDSILVKIINMV